MVNTPQLQQKSNKYFQQDQAISFNYTLVAISRGEYLNENNIILCQ